VLMAGVLAALALADHVGWAEVRRALPLPAFAVLTCSTMLTLLVQCLAYYLRAHRQERLTLVGVLSGALYGVAAWLVVGRLGNWGVLVSHLAVTGLVTLPLTIWIFRKYRREWTTPLPT
jgi:O-antigen/teichoic acid export membrane protein